MADRNTILNYSAGVASVVVAVVLVALKLWALVATGALSVAASLADNAIDVMMSVAALAAIAYAARPADDDHTFGHSSAEDLAALLQSALVLLSATMISVVALRRLFAADPAPVQAEGARASKAAIACASAAGAASGASVSSSAACSGMQIFSQTSQVALAVMAKRSPGFASAGTLISTGSSTVLSKPKLTKGSEAIALGAGHWIGPAVAPSGNCQSILVGSPESPGLRQ